MITVNRFVKRYNEVEAVKGITFSVDQGEIFGLIGPDGAGKTTTMRAICTLLVPDEGKILVNELDATRDIGKIRALLGYMPQRFSLYQDLSVEQNLNFFARLFRVPSEDKQKRLEQLYRFSRLGPFKNRKAGQLSGGMKQKLALSCCLIHTPEILVLDEPTFGVDPVSRQEFWHILQEIRDGGTTILVSTAYMDEADLCDRVALCLGGEIVALDTPKALRQAYPSPLFKLTGKNLYALRAFFSQLEAVRSTQMFGDSLHISFDVAPEDSDWKSWRQDSNQNLTSWQPQTPSIEDVFLEFMN